MPDKHGYGGASRRRPALALILAFLALASGILNPSGIGASTMDVPVSSVRIKEFMVGSNQKRFGRLEFVGGLLMRSAESSFGAISSIRFQADGRNFIAVLDTGHWLTGSIARGTDGTLSGLSDVHIAPILDRSGEKARRKVERDAEGLALRGDRAYVSYEQFPRIEIFAAATVAEARPVGQLPHLIHNSELRRNAGLETLVPSPETSPLKGALVTVAENSIDANGNLFAAILEGSLKGLFAVKRHGSFAVTDGAFLPNGDLLLLERRFNLAEGMGMRIRRIRGEDIRPGAIVDGEELIEADLSHQIDNMEGMDVIRQPDGSIRIILVSDDNHSFLQRNVMLEFKLLD